MNEFYFLVLLCVPSSIAQKNQSQVTRQLLKNKIAFSLASFIHSHSVNIGQYQLRNNMSIKVMARADRTAWDGLGQCVPKEIQLNRSKYQLKFAAEPVTCRK